MFDFLTQIPEGWRFITCDWSIQDQCRVIMVMTDSNRKKWYKLSDGHKEIIPLYRVGKGKDFQHAFYNALEKCLPICEDYQI